MLISRARIGYFEWSAAFLWKGGAWILKNNSQTQKNPPTNDSFKSANVGYIVPIVNMFKIQPVLSRVILFKERLFLWSSLLLSDYLSLLNTRVYQIPVSRNVSRKLRASSTSRYLSNFAVLINPKRGPE